MQGGAGGGQEAMHIRREDTPNAADAEALGIAHLAGVDAAAFGRQPLVKFFKVKAWVRWI
jgi:hypothetical protein